MKRLTLILLVISLLFVITSCASVTPEADTTTSNECEVIFEDHDGNVLKVEKVEIGDSAEPPVAAEREDYKFVEWDTSFDEVTQDIVVKPVYEEIKDPTLIVDTVHAQGKDVVVKVRIKKNPGILSLLLNTIYVEQAMKLTKIETGSVLEDYTFIEPKALTNACNAAWYILDVPENVIDGEVALLHFELSEDVSPGTYEVSVTCDHGAYDADLQEVPFEPAKGYVIVEPSAESEDVSK